MNQPNPPSDGRPASQGRPAPDTPPTSEDTAPGPRPVIITGANSGVGFEAALRVAEAGHPVVMVCRNRERGEAALTRVRQAAPRTELTLELCDLGVMDEVRDLAERLRPVARRAQALANNAGLYRPELEITPDGLERTMAVNHLGHYLLTRLLEDELREAGARIVNVTSKGHFRARMDRAPLEELLTGPKDYNGIQAYCDSKMCNVLFTRELVRRWGDDIRSNALHPGVLATEIWDGGTLFMWFMRTFAKPFMQDPRVGGQALSFLALHRQVSETTDTYFDKDRPAVASPVARDTALSSTLWDLSARLVGLPA